MRFWSFNHAAFGICAAAVLAGCGHSQAPIDPLGESPQGSAITRTTSAHGLYGIPAPNSAKKGIYVSEYLASNADIFGYPANNRENGPAFCSESAAYANDIDVDLEGDLTVAEGYSGVTVFKGPRMCGRKLGSFHTLFYDDYATDVASNDARHGTIAVAIYQEDGSGYGSIELCTLAKRCSQDSLQGPAMNEVFGVAMSATGDCWASSAVPTALTYFKGCANPGQTATGFVNPSIGGLEIDKRGNLLSFSVSSSASEVYVYSGCNPNCNLIGGPFSLHGEATDGHLNKDGSQLVTADYQYGQIDVYKYKPTVLTYLYSFNNGLSVSSGLVGAAYNPSSQ